MSSEIIFCGRILLFNFSLLFLFLWKQFSFCYIDTIAEFLFWFTIRWHDVVLLYYIYTNCFRLLLYRKKYNKSCLIFMQNTPMYILYHPKDGTWLTLSLFETAIVVPHGTLHNTYSETFTIIEQPVQILYNVNVSLMHF